MYKVWGFRDEKLEKKNYKLHDGKGMGWGIIARSFQQEPLSRGKIDVDKFLNSGERPHK